MKIENDMVDSVRRDEPRGTIDCSKNMIHPAEKSVSMNYKATKKRGTLKEMNLKMAGAYSTSIGQMANLVYPLFKDGQLN
ncbi:hypothetical protein JCM10550A_19850 [Methanogenium cariaci]|jgi:hypothetical protein